MKVIKNAVIESTMLGVEDHGIMTCFLNLNYGGSGQGFGGYGLDEPIKKNGKFIRRQGSAYGMEFIKRILETLEVETWEKLKGEKIRVEAEEWGEIYKIGHYIKDKWFEPKKDLSYFFL